MPNSIFESPGSSLDPYIAESQIQKHAEDVERLLQGNAQIRAEYDRVNQQAQHLMAAFGRSQKDSEDRLGKIQAKITVLQDAVWRISHDAESVINSKYWKRTKFRRKLSNSLRKRRGRPAKTWPDTFNVGQYLDNSNAVSEVTAPDKSKRLNLIPYSGYSQQLHLTCVSMFRNEELRADDMMRHLCALFDRVILIDHLSTDRTRDIVARYNGHAGTEVVILSGQDLGYYQSEYMTAAARALNAEQRSDWLFFLDFDEILPFPSRDIFLQALVPLVGADVIHSNWYNLATGDEPLETMQNADVMVGPNVSEFTKVALNLRKLHGQPVTIAQGNHSTLVDGKNYIGERAFGLFHLPINGRETFLQKLKQGTRAYENTDGHSSVEGSHWHDLLGEYEKVTQDPVLWREVALRYGEPLKDILADIQSGKLTNGARPLRLTYAQVEAAPDKSPEALQPPSFTIETIDAVMALTFPRQDSSSTDAVAPLSKAIYETLPAIPSFVQGSSDERPARVHNAMIAAATELEVLALPTAWSGHKAFLFSLMEAMRPRRYVELGSHAGASFFAACQHIKMNGAYGEAVAVDLWEGDHQAGFYSEQVFNDFKYRLNTHFPNIGSYIRGYFSQAVALFEKESIDLLHIDGLHTYEAVKEDFETWRPALSNNGTIIFHDTSEYQTDFGVWQLFEEIEEIATASFRFRHCHGLGVLAFGDRDHNPAIELLEYLSENPSRSERYYATLGSALFEQALRRNL